MGPRDRRQRRRRVAVAGGAAVMANEAPRCQAKQSKRRSRRLPSSHHRPSPLRPSSRPPAGGLTPEAIEQLRQLGELHEQNVLTDEEFELEKTKLLGNA